MKLTGNTIFITGGGSGIGRGLAEAFHELGNKVIIAGRRKGHLAETLRANPGMESVELDVADPASIAAVAKELIASYPKLNVLVNNAGIMHIDDVSGPIEDAVAVATVTTNLLGPRLRPPLTLAAIYSSTKAAIHSYSLSLRYKLRNTPVAVLEITPPWVQTDLLNSNNEPRAMPLAEFIDETIKVLGTASEEVLVERARPLRNNPGPAEGAFVTEFNDMMAQPSA